MSNPLLRQINNRGRNDAYGLNVNNGWYAGEDAAFSVPLDTAFRVRFTIDETGVKNGTFYSDGERLYWRVDTGGGYGSWNAVSPSTGHVLWANATNFVGGTDVCSTQLLGSGPSGSFPSSIYGGCYEYGATSASNTYLKDEFWEVEVCVALASANGATAGYKYQLLWMGGYMDGTEGNHTLIEITATGQQVTSTAALALSKPSISASGTVLNPVSGTASLALSNPSISAAGSADIDGTAALSLANPSISATGYVTNVFGTASLALAVVSIAATGSLEVSGSASLALTNPTVAAAGAATVGGTATLPLTGPTIVASGTVATIVTGTASLALSNPTIVASAPKFADVRRAILDAIDGSLAEAHSWDTEKANLPVTDVVRTSDTVVTITLSALGNYAITEDEVLQILVPAKAVLSGFGITATPTVTISNISLVSGTASLALTNPSIAATGTVLNPVSGTASLALANPAIAATGSLAVSGSASLALAVVQIAATGSVDIDGTASLALSNPSITASGTATVGGTASLALANPTIAATGTVFVGGTASLALGNPAIAASGSVDVTGTASLALVNPSIAATGSVFQAVTGTASLALTNPAITASGEEIFSGSAVLALQTVTIAATGTAAGHIGTAALALTNPSIAASGAVEYSGTASLGLTNPSIAASGTVTQNVTGTASLALANPSIAASGALAVSGTAALALANPSIAATGSVLHKVSVGGTLGPTGALSTAALFHRVVGGTLIQSDLAGVLVREVSHIVIGSLDGDLAGALGTVFQGAGENYQNVAGTLGQTDLQGTLGIQVQKACAGGLTPTGALGKGQFLAVAGASSIGTGALGTELNPIPAGDDITMLVIRLHRKKRLLYHTSGGGRLG